MSSTINDIKKQLKAYKQKFYRTELLKGGIFFTALAIGTLLLLTFIEYLSHLPSTGRLILLVIYIATISYGITKWILWPIYQLLNLNKYLTDKEAAKQIGQFFPNVNDKLLNTLELQNSTIQNNALLLASITQKSKSFIGLDFREAVSHKKNKKHLYRYLIPSVALIVLVLSIQPSIVSLSTERIVNYNNLEYDIPFTFTLSNTPTYLIAGEQQTLEVIIEGRDGIPTQAFAYINDKQKLLEKSGKTFKFSITPSNKTKKIALQFSTSGYRSNINNFKVYLKPKIEDFSFLIKHPAYTNLPDKIVKNSTSINVPLGSKVLTTINSKNSKKLYYRTKDTLYNFERKSDKSFTYLTEINENKNFELVLKNNKTSNISNYVHKFKLINDRYPLIQYKSYTDTLLSNYILFQGLIQDDYGISNFYFNYKVKNRTNILKKVKIRIKKNAKNQQFLYDLQLSKLNLESNDQLEYFFSVKDNDAINGPKEYRTPKTIHITPSTNEINKQLDEQTKRTNTQMSDTKDQSNNINKDIEKIQKELKTKKQLTIEDKKEIEELTKDHKDLTKNIKELKKQFQQDQLQTDRFSENSKETTKKIEHLQRLMDQLMENDSKDLMKKLSENDDINQAQKNLEQLNKSDQELQKELERTIELYKRLKTEQKIEKNIKDLEKLAQKQADLARNNKENDNKDISPKQEELNKEFDALKKEMKEVQKLNQQLKKPMELQNFEQEQQDISQDMQNAKDQLEQNQKGTSKKSQQNASNKMQKLAAAIKKMQDSMNLDQMMENLDNLRQILHNLLYLSKEQEYLTKSLKKTQPSNPMFVEVSRDQINLNISSKVVEDSLYALASRTFQIEPYITKELGEMKNFMIQSDHAIKARKRPSAVTKQQFAMTSMNNLALLLDEVLAQMQQSIANSKPGQQMCNKPGGSSSKPNLGQMQQKLNEGIKQLSKGQKEGRSPSEQLAKMAAQQRQIKNELNNLQKANNNSKELAKQIEDLKRLMNQSENDLINKRTNTSLVKRQQVIQVKLLEVEKASKQQEYDNERESKIAQTVQSKYPPALENYLKDKQNQIELIKTIPPNFTPYYKEEINRYYNRIK